MKKHLSAIWHVPRDLAGHLVDESHRSHPLSESVMRHGYVLTRGRSRRALRRFFGIVRPVTAAQRSAHAELVAVLRNDGVTSRRRFLEPDRARALADEIESLPGYTVGAGFRRVDEPLSSSTGVRYQYLPETLLQLQSVRELVSEPYFQEVAAAYFGCVPVFTQVSAWWTLPKVDASSAELDSSAQQFHFDYDWLMFLKFFVYLTDVPLENGPFTYVRGTHEAKREWRDGRIDDATIGDSYRDRVVPMTGAAGDLIVADTAGYHKGQRARAGRRLLLQFEFAISRFGASSRYALLPKAHRPTGRWPSTFAVFSG